MACLLIVDDDPRVRRALRRMLEQAEHVVVEGATVGQGLSALEDHDVDLVITDMEMPEGGGLELLRQLPEVSPYVPAIVLTGRPTLDSCVEAMRLDAIDYVSKPGADLAERVDAALQRGRRRSEALRSREALEEWERFIDEASSRLSALRSRQPDHVKMLGELSEREREVCQLLLRGHSSSQIGAELHISPHTVRNHMKAIFRKLEVNSQLELISRFA